MVQIYSPSNTSYSNNGDMVLQPTSCELNAELNGTWTLILTHPIDDEGRWKLIEENAVLKVPTWMSTKQQRYRIVNVEKTMDAVTATAYPVFFDSANDAYIIDIRVTAKTVAQTLTSLFAAAPNKYSYEVTGTTTSRATYEFHDTNLMSALEIMKDVWNVEFLYDNNKLWVAEAQGTDNGVTVEYGKNITGIEYYVDMSEVATRIIPYAYNGRMISGSSPWVDSSLVNTYPKVFVKGVQFDCIKLAEDATDEDMQDSSIIICQNQAALNSALQTACQGLYSDGIDKPKVTMSIDMLALEATEEYKGLSGLEQIRLGDTVHCKHSKLGIVSDARCVGIVWDCAQDRIQAVTLGDFAYDYFKEEVDLSGIQHGLDQIAASFNSDGTVMAERVKGILNGMQTQLQAQYTASERTNVMAILFENTDTNSPLYGALGIGTQGFQIAKTKDGQGNWVWTTAATANGILADAIITGLLTDATANSYWDLDTGRLVMKNGNSKTVIDINAPNGTATIGGFVVDDTTLSSRYDYVANGTYHDFIIHKMYNSQTKALQVAVTNKSTLETTDYFYVNYAGKMYAKNAEIEGSIVATSLTLGNNVSISSGKVSGLAAVATSGSYSDLSNKPTIPDVSIYIAKDGTIGHEPGDGYTGFKVSSAGLLTCSNAVVYGTVYSSSGLIGGWTIDADEISCGNIHFQKENLNVSGNPSTITLGSKNSSTYYINGNGWAKFSNVDSNYGDFSTGLNCSGAFWVGSGSMTYLAASSNGVRIPIFGAEYLGTDNQGKIVVGGSSRRFKIISKVPVDVEGFYKLNAVMARYKPGFLSENDELDGKDMPMLIAEEVEEVCKEAVIHGDEGQAKDWRFRVMIPVHQQMLVEQHKKIEELEARIARLEALLGGDKQP